MFDAEGRVAEIQAQERARLFQGYTGYSENFNNAIGTMIDEDLSISSRLDPRREISSNPIEFTKNLFASHRTRKIDQMQKLIVAGKISQELKDQYTERKARAGNLTDWESLAVEANKTLAPEDRIETQAEFEVIQKEELAQRRALVDDASNRSTAMGTFGSFVGSAVAGSSMEPIAVFTAHLAVPASGIKALSKTAYAFSIAGRSAALNVGVQIPIEPFVHSWKEEIGAEYTWKDAMFNLVAAGAFGGVVGGGSAVAGILLGSGIDAGKLTFLASKDRNVLRKGFEDLGLDENESDVFAEVQLESNNRPDGEESEEFAAKLEVRQEEMDKTDLPADPEPDEVFDATQDNPITEEIVAPKGGKRITREDRVKALEAEEEVSELDLMYDNVSDDLTIHVEGRTIKAKNFHKPIDEELTTAKKIRECVLSA